MNIGVIGAGKIGSILVKNFTRLGHHVSVANKQDVNSLRKLCHATGAQAVTLSEVCQNVEFLFLCVPLVAIPEIARSLKPSLTFSTIVVDTGNYFPPRDGRIEEIEQGQVESVWVAQQIDHPVLKAFNSIIDYYLENGGLPPDSPDRLSLPVSGDSAEAKNKLLHLIAALGFDGFDAGSLKESWRQQMGTPIYCTNLTRSQAIQAIKNANRENSISLREIRTKKLLESSPRTPEEVLKMTRELQGITNK